MHHGDGLRFAVMDWASWSWIGHRGDGLGFAVLDRADRRHRSSTRTNGLSNQWMPPILLDRRVGMRDHDRYLISLLKQKKSHEKYLVDSDLAAIACSIDLQSLAPYRDTMDHVADSIGVVGNAIRTG
ncbi:hypothetical protein RMSM_04966 [Rhodopirellula maiorica SM1]|uniref:Uncharacterized protein n=1 Tax=Rhodopirellula maiorica SM1 TaxID=1265738 RepID=M5RRS6_9BACT|nr:hypothetical protein RMSM_04966 [Rhodopirellula maiorica SM1]